MFNKQLQGVFQSVIIQLTLYFLINHFKEEKILLFDRAFVIETICRTCQEIITKLNLRSNHSNTEKYQQQQQIVTKNR